MSKIHVSYVEYMGMKYEVAICDPKAGWGDKAGKFYVPTALVIPTDYYDTFTEAKDAVNKLIDEWRGTNPQSLSEWVDMIEKCMVWTGYEDCELDKEEVEKILQRFKKAQIQ